MMENSLWAVIAAKNEDRHITEVIKGAKIYVDRVVVVDDGSTDETEEAAKREGAIVLRHLVNVGKGAALKTGCEYAIEEGASIIVMLDADGQHDPKEIPLLIENLKENDIVFGARVRKKSMPLVLKFGNWFIYKVAQLLYGVSIADTQCGFRAFRAKVYEKLQWESPGYSVESEIIANAGKNKLKYMQVPISTIYADKYKGTTIIDGIKIVGNMIWWRLSR